MKKKLLVAILIVGFLTPVAAFASKKCDVYHDAIMHCAKQGCDTNMDDFINCLVDEEGITDKAKDGTDEVKELVKCFKTEYECK